MALAINLTAGSTVLESHREAEIGKYYSFGNILFYSKFQSSPTKYEEDKYLPLDKSRYKTPAEYWNKVMANLTSRTYGVFKDNNSVYYTVFPFVDNLAKFEVLRANDVAPNDETVTDTIDKIAKVANKYYIAGAGPFFTGYSLVDTRKVYGPVYINNSLMSNSSNSVASNPGNMAIESKVTTIPNSFGGFKYQFAFPSNDATGGDGFSSLSKLIYASTARTFIESGDNMSDEIKYPTKGRQVFAHSQSKNCAFHIIKSNETNDSFASKRIQEFLMWVGFENAAYFDGSDSVVLFEFKSVGKGRYIVDSIKDASSKNGEFKFFFAIKKTY